MPSDPAEQLLRRLHDQTTLAREVSRTEDRERIVGERRRHLRTIRSAARSRNRPRRGLAWLILVALVLLLLAATRAEGAPLASGDDSDSEPAAGADLAADVEDDDRADTDLADRTAPDGGSNTLDAAVTHADDPRDLDGASETLDDADADLDGASETLDDADADLDAGERSASDPRDLDGASDDADADLDERTAYDARDLDGVSETLDAEDDAAFDHPSIRDAIETGAVFSSTAFADASELEDLELRHQRPSRWGRLDLTVAWRRVWRPGDPVISLAPGATGSPTPFEHTDTLWVFATWRN